MIQQSDDTVVEVESSENDRETEPLVPKPNVQTDQAPSPTFKWIFEIFHGEEHVYGIRQIKKNGSESQSEKFIGTPGGKAVHIELMDGKQIQTVTFSGLN